MHHEYREEVLRELSAHGVRPKPTTAPELVRDFLNDLYRYEIRRLRDRLLRGDFPKREYSDRVVSLRRRYRLMSVPTKEWTV